MKSKNKRSKTPLITLYMFIIPINQFGTMYRQDLSQSLVEIPKPYHPKLPLENKLS